MHRTDLLLLDEPTEGLMPSMINLIREVIKTLKEKGVSFLLVEQRIDAVLAIADRVAFIENGRLMEILNVEAVDGNPKLLKNTWGLAEKSGCGQLS